MTDDGRRAIAWFRRDLRLTDNRMLEAATRNADRVWPVFVADPELLASHGAATARIAWFDDGAYIRRWVRELADLDAAQIHEPWRAPTTPRDYPPPILDHAEARQRTLARYAAARQG